jgi:UDP-N-acetylglucosamine 4,6-dehydratase/5-epimerase
VILVTGGTGSFGRAFIERNIDRERVTYRNAYANSTETIRQPPLAIRVLSRDEEKQRQLHAMWPNVELVLGDVRDPYTVRKAMEGVTQVFHAAALKQVPSCEDAPLEAIKTNALGTENVCAAAREVGARVVTLSTDKAVEPIGVMGATKMLAESITTQWGFNCVRYGNVVGSRGSIIPLFREQMKRGKPITITDPLMTRFLITLDEALDLLDTAMDAAPKGTIYVKKSPSATVGQIVRVMAPDHPTNVIGIRPGEKRHEHLIVPDEAAQDHGDYYQVTRKGTRAGITYSSETAPRLTDPELAALLAQAPDAM